MTSEHALERTGLHEGAASRHADAEAFASGLAEIQNSPKDRGTVAMIVARPEEGARSVLERATLSPEEGLAEDRWRLSSWRKLPDGLPDPAVQITLMNARCIALVAGARERWPLAGDNLFVDLDLSHENLPVGTRLQVGGAILEITQPPHTGCHKFKHRFGSAAVEFVNSLEGKALRLRGVHARVVDAGAVAVGDAIERCNP